MFSFAFYVLLSMFYEQVLGHSPTDPSVRPTHTSSPIPQRPTYSEPGGRRPPGQRRLELSAGQLAAATGWGMRPSRPEVGLRAGDVHCSHDHCHPLYPISHSSAMVRTDRKSFHLTKQKPESTRDPILLFVLSKASFHQPELLRKWGWLPRKWSSLLPNMAL